MDGCSQSSILTNRVLPNCQLMRQAHLDVALVKGLGFNRSLVLYSVPDDGSAPSIQYTYLQRRLDPTVRRPKLTNSEKRRRTSAVRPTRRRSSPAPSFLGSENPPFAGASEFRSTFPYPNVLSTHVAIRSSLSQSSRELFSTTNMVRVCTNAYHTLGLRTCASRRMLVKDSNILTSMSRQPKT